MAGYYERVIRFSLDLFLTTETEHMRLCSLTVSRSQVPRLNAEKSV